MKKRKMKGKEGRKMEKKYALPTLNTWIPHWWWRLARGDVSRPLERTTQQEEEAGASGGGKRGKARDRNV
jgi:hypothetical protein